jgi:hypothetical protein
MCDVTFIFDRRQDRGVLSEETRLVGRAEKSVRAGEIYLLFRKRGR